MATQASLTFTGVGSPNAPTDHLDVAERIQHISSLKDGLDYEGQLHDVEVETGFVISLSDEEIALYEAASEASFHPAVSKMRHHTSLRTNDANLFPVKYYRRLTERDHLDVAERIQHISSLEDGLDYEGQLHDVEVETGFVISLSDEEIAIYKAASEARSSKSEEEEDLALEEALNSTFR
nr:hypothetical protein [Tanacetum cinerariifolium]